MASHSALKRLRIRRTIAKGSPARAALSRSLWGVPPPDARQALEEQRQAFAAETSALESQVKAEAERLTELKQEIERQKKQLQALRQVVQSLRGKLANERAARAVLATRLRDRDAEQQRSVAAEAARLESIRLEADIQQEHEALRQLVASLYRSIAGRQGVPAGYDVVAQIPAAASRAGAVRPVAPWHRFLLGKKAGQTLSTADGRVIIQAGETIGPDELAAAEREGVLFDLILTAKVAERIPEL